MCNIVNALQSRLYINANGKWPKVDSMSQLKKQLKLSKCVNKKIKSCKKLISMSPIPACFQYIAKITKKQELKLEN